MVVVILVIPVEAHERLTRIRRPQIVSTLKNKILCYFASEMSLFGNSSRFTINCSEPQERAVGLFLEKKGRELGGVIQIKSSFEEIENSEWHWQLMG